MTNIQPLTTAAAFAHGWWMDWCEDPSVNGARAQVGGVAQVAANRQNAIPVGRTVSGPQHAYKLPDRRVVTVNPGGPAARAHYCSQNSYNCNFCQGTGLIFALDPDTLGQPDRAPIHLVFSKPVHAVGTYISGADAAGTLSLAFTALLWTRLANGTDWEPAVTAAGKLAPAGPAQGIPTAPFVGALSLDPGGITEACFDVALFGNFRFSQVAIAELYGMG